MVVPAADGAGHCPIFEIETRKSGRKPFLDEIDGFDIACRDASTSAHSFGWDSANGRAELFSKPEDYYAFERNMVATMRRFPIRLLAYCLMPNHWHKVLWPRKDDEVTAFLRWLTLTHSQRLHAHRHTTGYGHI